MYGSILTGPPREADEGGKKGERGGFSKSCHCEEARRADAAIFVTYLSDLPLCKRGMEGDFSE